uniref:GH10 domain-containing protein n=1 Tax=Oryza brachyantha TaxID=4533 RepID=J3LWM5_ORYBR
MAVCVVYTKVQVETHKLSLPVHGPKYLQSNVLRRLSCESLGQVQLGAWFSLMLSRDSASKCLGIQTVKNSHAFFYLAIIYLYRSFKENFKNEECDPYKSCADNRRVQNSLLSFNALSSFPRRQRPFIKAASNVKAILVTPDGKFNTADMIVTQCNCWTMLKGGATSYAAGNGDIFEEKMKVKITVEGTDGKVLAEVEVKLERVAKVFLLGNEMTKEILDMSEYERWFTSWFQYATLENKMKWYSTEFHRNQDYRVVDKMVELAKKHNISLRGHVFWDDQTEQMEWVSKLSMPRLKEAMAKRLTNVVTRYVGMVIHWDVVNENLHFSFFKGKLGKDTLAQIFKDMAKLDGKPILFMNEFNTIEQPNDPTP